MTAFPITGKTRFVAMIGDPVIQVKSPLAFADWAESAGVDAVMLPIQVAAGSVAETLNALRGWGNCAGCVVTYPHKQAAVVALDEMAEAVALVGACNVIRRTEDGRLLGDMTDGLGFVSALTAKGHSLKGIDARLIGAGGAGSAIALALLDAGVERLVVVDSDSTRVDALIAKLQAARPGEGRFLDEAPADFYCGLVCNATPVGMNEDQSHPFPLDNLPSECIVADIVPSPAETCWVRAARAAGHPVQTGPEMVAGQMPVLISILFPNEFEKDSAKFA